MELNGPLSGLELLTPINEPQFSAGRLRSALLTARYHFELHLNGISPVPTTRKKPFDVLTEGLELSNKSG